MLLAACGEATVIRGTTQLTDTPDTLGPYTVITDVVDPDGLDAVWLPDGLLCGRACSAGSCPRRLRVQQRH